MTLTVSGTDLEDALQYGATSGLPRLVNWLEVYQGGEHGRPKGEGEAGDWRISIGSGSQDLVRIHSPLHYATDEADNLPPSYPKLSQPY